MAFTFVRTLDCLTLFDRINIANCAMKRAKQHSHDGKRFHDEYETAKVWMEHRVENLNGYCYMRSLGTLPPARFN